MSEGRAYWTFSVRKSPLPHNLQGVGVPMFRSQPPEDPAFTLQLDDAHTCLLRVAQPQVLGGGDLEEGKEGYFPLRANQAQVDAATTITPSLPPSPSVLIRIAITY